MENARSWSKNIKKEGSARCQKQEMAVLRKLKEKSVYKKILDPVAPTLCWDRCLIDCDSYFSPSVRNTARER